ncbi:MAG TPA: 4Fe-4S ferredoxin [Clostridiales bacterium UBA8153]|nr:4Fe-4S ferredoxin [Clostridiales bacterium UBA8153]
MLERTGVPTPEQLALCLPGPERARRGAVAVFECFEKIPCDPCYEACSQGAVLPFTDINDLPQVDHDRCNGCGNCVQHCPGLAIFVVDCTWAPGKALLKLPYELLPLPEAGEALSCYDREGKRVGEGTTVRVVRGRPFLGTPVVWVELELDRCGQVRHVRPREGGAGDGAAG